MKSCFFVMNGLDILGFFQTITQAEHCQSYLLSHNISTEIVEGEIESIIEYDAWE